MKIGIASLSIIGILVVFCGFQVSAVTPESWGGHPHGTTFLTADQTALILASAADGLARERALTDAALNSAQPISDKVKARLVVLRQCNDHTLGAALRQAQSFAGLTEIRDGRTAIAELDRAITQIAALRRYADAALGVEAEIRDPGIVQDWPYAITKSINSTQHLKATLERVAAPISAGLV